MKRYKLKKKYKISLLLILILLSIVSTIAVSYSLWFVTKNQDDTNLVVSGCFDVIYNDLDDNDAATSINLANTYPISEMQLIENQLEIDLCEAQALNLFVWPIIQFVMNPPYDPPVSNMLFLSMSGYDLSTSSQKFIISS